MMGSRYPRLESSFDADHVDFRSNLSRWRNSMVVMIISMYFLTGLPVNKDTSAASMNSDENNSSPSA
jgi:hypothetical protein